MDDSPTQNTFEERSKPQAVGPFVAIVIVVMLLAIGGLYFFITQEIKLHQMPSPENLPAQTGQATS